MSFSLPDQRCFEYAQGYFELGMLSEAEQELGLLTPKSARSVSVLSLQLEIHMQGREWSKMMTLAKSLARAQPEKASWFIQWAYAAREKNQIRHARRVLLRVIHRFPENALVQYNLGCYHTLLQDLDDGYECVMLSFKLDPSLKSVAAKDTDLTALWPRLAERRKSSR